MLICRNKALHSALQLSFTCLLKDYIFNTYPPPEEQEIEFEKALSDKELAEKLSFAKTMSYEEIMKNWKEQVKSNQTQNAKS